MISFSTTSDDAVPHCAARLDLPYNTANKHTSIVQLLGFSVQNIPLFYQFNLLFILLTLKFEAVDTPFGEQPGNLGVVKSGGARIEGDNVLPRRKGGKLTASRRYWKEIFGSGCI